MIPTILGIHRLGVLLPTLTSMTTVLTIAAQSLQCKSVNCADSLGLVIERTGCWTQSLSKRRQFRSLPDAASDFQSISQATAAVPREYTGTVPHNPTLHLYQNKRMKLVHDWQKSDRFENSASTSRRALRSILTDHSMSHALL